MEPRARRKRAYELPGMTTLRAPQDPIREIENEAIRDLSNEYRTLRIEEMISKKRQQISKGPISGIQSQKDNLEMFKMFMELQKLNQPKDKPDQTLEYLKYFNNLMQTAGAGPNFFEQYSRAKELGIVSQSEAGDPNQFSVEMEKLRGERMLSGKKIDLEIMKMRLEQEDGRDKLALLAQILAPVAAYSGAKMSEDMRARGADAANKIMNPEKNIFKSFMEQGGIINPGSLAGQTAEMRVACDCGYDKTLVVPVPPPESLACPGCGKQLMTAPHSGDDEETRSEWSDHK